MAGPQRSAITQPILRVLALLLLLLWIAIPVTLLLKGNN